MKEKEENEKEGKYEKETRRKERKKKKKKKERKKEKKKKRKKLGPWRLRDAPGRARASAPPRAATPARQGKFRL